MMRSCPYIVVAVVLMTRFALAQDLEPPDFEEVAADTSADEASLEDALAEAADAKKAAEQAQMAAQEAQAAADAASLEIAQLKEQLEAAAKKKDEKKKKKKKEEKKSYQGALKQEPGLKIGARLYVMWSLQHTDEDPLHEFSLNMARVKFTWSQWKLVEAVLKLDVDHLIEDASTAAIVRDVYVHIQPWSWLGLRIGQFKKEFSKLETTSRAKLPSIERGFSNDWIVEELGYGDRDLGLMLEGRILEKIKLDYMIGVFNGAGGNVSEIDINGWKDIVMRVDARPIDWLSVGVNASLKFIGDDDLERFVDPANFDFSYTMDDFKDDHEWMTGLSWMTGVDAVFRIQKFRILLENMFGESWWFKSVDYRYSWSVVLQLSYKWKLKKGLKIYLEPLVRTEMLTLLPSAGEWSARAWQIVPGINLHLGDHVRVMINGDFVVTQGSEPDESTGDGLWPGEWPGPWENSSRLLIQVAFSI